MNLTMPVRPTDIKDRISFGDNKFVITQISPTLVSLLKSPDDLLQEATPINKAMLQAMENWSVWLYNVISENKSAPRTFDLSDLSRFKVNGVYQNGKLTL